MRSIDPIFGGEAKVKMMRLFIGNPNQAFDLSEVAERTQEASNYVRQGIRDLLKAGLIRPKGYLKRTVQKKRGKVRETTRRARGYVLNHEYPHLVALSDFLVDASPVTDKEIVKRLSRACTNPRLILLAGAFTHDPESRVDLLVVADHIRQSALLSAIGTIEAELGKEIRYAAFETPTFRYRMGVYDKLLRDILDFPHQKILNKLGV